MVCVCCEVGERAIFILLRVGSRQMHICKVIRYVGHDSSSKCTWTGGRPAPPGHLSSLSFSGRLTGGPSTLSYPIGEEVKGPRCHIEEGE